MFLLFERTLCFFNLICCSWTEPFLSLIKNIVAVEKNLFFICFFPFLYHKVKIGALYFFWRTFSLFCLSFLLSHKVKNGALSFCWFCKLGFFSGSKNLFYFLLYLFLYQLSFYCFFIYQIALSFFPSFDFSFVVKIFCFAFVSFFFFHSSLQIEVFKPFLYRNFLFFLL